MDKWTQELNQHLHFIHDMSQANPFDMFAMAATLEKYTAGEQLQLIVLCDLPTRSTAVRKYQNHTKFPKT